MSPFRSECTLPPSSSLGVQECINSVSAAGGNVSNERVIRIFKIFRLLRIARILRLVKMIACVRDFDKGGGAMSWLHELVMEI